MQNQQLPHADPISRRPSLLAHLPDGADSSEFDRDGGAVVVWLVGAIAFYVVLGLAWLIAITTGIM